MTIIQHGSPSEFEYDSKETDPKEPEDDPEEDDASVASDSTYKSSGHDTDRTRRTNILNRNHRRNQRKHKEHWDRHPTNAKREEDRSKGKVVLSLFWDSPKDGRLNLYWLAPGGGRIPLEGIRQQPS